MKITFRSLGLWFGFVASGYASNAAAAQTPCGNFDFSSGISCKIEVEGGCSAKCEPLNLKAGCKGQCVSPPTPGCTDSCGTQCVAMCNPALLNCFEGCHSECDQPTIDVCTAEQPNADCVAYAKAQCDNHCEESCAVPPDNCQEHCNACCSGGCSSLANFSCDFDCFFDLKGGCDVQCQQPAGAIFCNGQYVGADDIEACISYLATQGITVDVSARVSGELQCGLSGCEGVGEGDVKAGLCSLSKDHIGVVGPSSRIATALGLLGLTAGLAAMRRRGRSARPRRVGG